MRTDTAQPIRLKDYRPPDWLVETVMLDVSLHPMQTKVRARLALKPNPEVPAAPLVLDGDGLSLQSLKLNGTELAADSYLVTPDQLTIPQPPNAPFILEVETLVDPTANTQLSGLYRSSGTYCTQCEAEGFRRITYFPDRPDVMAVYTTRIEADKNETPVLLSNGNLTDGGELPGGRHFAVWHDPHPKPAYLFALVGGNLSVIEDRFVTMSGRNVTLRIYVEPGKEDRCGYAMDSLKRAMRWDEEKFGREYDLDIFMIVAVSDFNMGAMENKGLNVFNDKYVLASAGTATDGDFAQYRSGDRARIFPQLDGQSHHLPGLVPSLPEGRSHRFPRPGIFLPTCARGRSNASPTCVTCARRNSSRTRGLWRIRSGLKLIRKSITSTPATVYEKGAEVVRMVQTLIGPEKFRTGMDLYFTRHDGEAATVEQFIQCFADASGRDMTQFMRWYSQAGTPEVAVAGRFDAARKTYTLEAKQSVPATPGQPTKQPMVIPLALGLVGKDGHDLPLALSNGGKAEGGVLVLSEPAASFEFTGVSERPALSINRGFSAPIKLSTDLDGGDLAFLAAHDSDAFNRWQSLQTISMRLLIDNVAALRAGKPPRGDDKLLAALAAILGDAALQPAFVALALVPPGEGDIAREIGRDIDPDAIFSARKALRRAIGDSLGPALAEAYDRMTVPGPYSPGAAGAGRRSLRNVALDLLAATAAPEAIARAARQYDAADNMTDRMAALATLSLHAGPERERAFADYYTRYAADALVIDKWFSLQAMIPQPETLDKVRDLTAHPAFSFANPNRVRALIGAFAQGNPTQFNRADGAGYDFIADNVLALDSKNPQLAARLATSFRTWRTLETGRRGKAQAALERIKAAPNLSRDLADIVERALAPH